jgi:phage shock protein PspC (stress-responsive transcriptional regulator)
MVRSFTDRVFGGVCGGLGAALRIDSWVLRGALVLAAILSGGLFAVTYLVLWWLTPQESLASRRRGFPTLLALVLIIATAAAWWARGEGLLVSPTGADLTLPGMALIAGVVFFLRQLGGRV